MRAREVNPPFSQMLPESFQIELDEGRKEGLISTPLRVRQTFWGREVRLSGMELSGKEEGGGREGGREERDAISCDK